MHSGMPSSSTCICSTEYCDIFLGNKTRIEPAPCSRISLKRSYANSPTLTTMHRRVTVPAVIGRASMLTRALREPTIKFT